MTLLNPLLFDFQWCLPSLIPHISHVTHSVSDTEIRCSKITTVVERSMLRLGHSYSKPQIFTKTGLYGLPYWVPSLSLRSLVPKFLWVESDKGVDERRGNKRPPSYLLPELKKLDFKRQVWTLREWNILLVDIESSYLTHDWRTHFNRLRVSLREIFLGGLRKERFSMGRNFKES